MKVKITSFGKMVGEINRNDHNQECDCSAILYMQKSKLQDDINRWGIASLPSQHNYMLRVFWHHRNFGSRRQKHWSLKTQQKVKISHSFITPTAAVITQLWNHIQQYDFERGILACDRHEDIGLRNRENRSYQVGEWPSTINYNTPMIS